MMLGIELRREPRWTQMDDVIAVYSKNAWIFPFNHLLLLGAWGGLYCTNQQEKRCLSARHVGLAGDVDFICGDFCLCSDNHFQ